MFEDELHGVVVAVQHDLRLEALERRQAALAIEFLVERLGDLLAGVGVPASVRVGTRGALLRGVLVGCANRRGLEAVVFEAAGGEFADVLLDNSSGVLDVLEPVYVVATGLGTYQTVRSRGASARSSKGVCSAARNSQRSCVLACSTISRR